MLKNAFNATVGDMWFRLPGLRIAQGHQRYSKRSTYVYLFEWSSPFIGAAHALDLMVFGNGLALPFLAPGRITSKPQRLCEKLG